MIEESDSLQWGGVVTARHLNNFQVQVGMDSMAEEKGRGPWSMIIDEHPGNGGDGVGPSPVFTAVAGLAA